MLATSSIGLSVVLAFAPQAAGEPAPAEAPSTAAPTIAPTADAVPFTFSRALAIGRVGRGGRSPIRFDAVESRLVRGEPVSPKEGDTVVAPDGEERTWTPIVANDGAFRAESLGGGYAFTTFEAAEPGTLVLEASGHSMVYVNGVPRTGDPYGYGFVRLPVPIRAGRNEFLFAVGRGGFAAKLVTPPSVGPYFLGADETLPDLVVGVSERVVLGIPVVNPTGGWLENVVAVASTAAGASVSTALPAIPPHSLHKARIEWDTPGSAEPGPLMLEIRIERRPADGAATPLATRTVELKTVTAESRRNETFTSRIDGSAQYYSVVPAVPRESGQRPGLLLSLHGASVEASSQAAAYTAKEWATIVCPTNRRPYGFDWEDWGRLDALEVLSHAQRRFRTDPRRQWLTGHSMGGHGTWQIGVHYSDRFAAIAPSAGWISFRSYTGGADFPTTGVGGLLMRAASPSDTLALKDNYARLGVYILHGDADDNVPVAQARTMRGVLGGGNGAFHPDFAYYERSGAGHWWGNECVDWPPLMQFLERRTRPEPGSINRVSFATSSPSVSAESAWVTVAQQVEFLKPSRVELALDRGARSVAGTTTNVARLGLALDLDGDANEITVTLDGTKLTAPEPEGGGRLWFARDGETWTLAGPPSPAEKSPERGGLFKEAFRNRMILVAGTAGDDATDELLLSKARFDALTFWYRGNGAIEVTTDVAFDAKADPDRNVILYGNAETNSAWPALLGSCPVVVRQGSVKVGDREIAGGDLAVLFTYPRAGSDRAAVGVVAGTGPAGIRLSERLPYFVSGVAYPDLTVLAARTLVEGLAGVRLTGFFGNDWSVERGVWAEAESSVPGP
jgi:poly(3-hydroxybutyrate) depolymerase